MRLATGLLIFAVALMLSACPKGGQPSDGGTTTHRSAATTWGSAHDFSYTTFDGRRQMISDNLGKPLVVNFWAMW